MWSTGLACVFAISIAINYRQHLELAELRNELFRWHELEHRPQSEQWMRDLQQLRDSQKSEENADDSSADTLLSIWRARLAASTPGFWSGERSELDCSSAGSVVMPKEDVQAETWSSSGASMRAEEALRECGFVYLDSLWPRQRLEAIRTAFEEFVVTAEARSFRYPCQGDGRVEHMLPYRAPFNDTSIVADSRLLGLLENFLGGRFKLELITVIDSPPGSGDQRWHQGWDHLFDEHEQLPPYATVVTIPLVDVGIEMGPTQFCPRKKLRHYHGWRCEEPVEAGSSLGSAAIFDYKTLHRGPSNRGNTSRPMISAVYTRSWFVNTDAMVNRGISLLQTLHQRLWWELFWVHPDDSDEWFIV